MKGKNIFHAGCMKENVLKRQAYHMFSEPFFILYLCDGKSQQMDKGKTQGIFLYAHDRQQAQKHYQAELTSKQVIYTFFKRGTKQVHTFLLRSCISFLKHNNPCEKTRHSKIIMFN